MDNDTFDAVESYLEDALEALNLPIPDDLESKALLLNQWALYFASYGKAPEVHLEPVDDEFDTPANV